MALRRLNRHRRRAQRAAPGRIEVRRTSWGTLGILAAVFLIIAAGAIWSHRWFGSTELPRLSIVVLPLKDLGIGPEQQYLADAVTEDLTTNLSRLADMFVIAADTAFTYQNKPIDAKQLGRELGVRYVLEGSIQRSGQQIRVNAQLIDAETGGHLWAERFGREVTGLFDVQNEIAGRIANTLGIELIAREAARPTNNPDALDYILRGRAVRFKASSPEGFARAFDLFERALALDPQSIEARSRLAGNLVGRVLDSMSDNARADLSRAEQLIDPVLSDSPRYAYAHKVKGQVLRAQHRFTEATLEFQTVLASDPNDTDALHALSFCKLMTGAIEEVIPIEERVIRLNPRDPYIGFEYARIGVVHLLQSRIDEAIFWLQKARRMEPEFKTIHSSLASAYALKGETERAAAELAKARQLSHDDRYVSIARLRAVGAGYWGVPKIQALFENTYFTGLRKAGMPDE
jgi:adenylate cyclase